MAILIDTQIRNDLYATGSITAGKGFTGSFSGSLTGTASHASTATSLDFGPLTASSMASNAYQLYSNATNTQTDSYTITSNDDGKMVIITSGSNVTVTLTTSSISPTFNCLFYQSGSGAILFTTASTDAVIRNRSSNTGSAGQYAIISIVRVPNGDFVLGGDTA